MSGYGYGSAYAEVQEDSAENGRSREREAFDRLVSALEAGEAGGPGSAEESEALRLTEAVWVFLVEEVTDASSSLPLETRGSIGSLGLWSIREVQEIRAGRRAGLRGLIDVAETIREGLAPEPSAVPRP